METGISINKNKLTNVFQYLILIVAIVFSPDTLIYGTNILFQTGTIGIFVQFSLVLVLLCLNFMTFKGKLFFKKKIIHVFVVVSLFMIMSCVILFQNYGGYFGVLLAFFVSVLYVSSVDFDTFLRQFENISMFLIVGSLVTYVLTLLKPSLSFGLPVITNTGGNRYRWYLFTFKNIYSGNTAYRNTGIFREPGIFQMYTNLTLMLIFLREKHEKNDYLKAILCAAACITCYSAGGIITLFSVLVAVLFSRNKETRSSKRTVLIIIVICSISYIWLQGTLIDQMMSKLTSTDNGSTASRLVSIYANLILFVKNPIFGAGATSMPYLFRDLATSISGYLVKDNTNTILYSFAAYGVIVGGIAVFGLVSFFSIVNQKRIQFLLLLLLIAILYSNENVFGTFLYFTLMLYGYKRQAIRFNRL